MGILMITTQEDRLLQRISENGGQRRHDRRRLLGLRLRLRHRLPNPKCPCPSRAVSHNHTRNTDTPDIRPISNSLYHNTNTPNVRPGPYCRTGLSARRNADPCTPRASSIRPKSQAPRYGEGISDSPTRQRP